MRPPSSSLGNEGGQGVRGQVSGDMGGRREGQANALQKGKQTLVALLLGDAINFLPVRETTAAAIVLAAAPPHAPQRILVQISDAVRQHGHVVGAVGCDFGGHGLRETGFLENRGDSFASF